MKSWDKYKAENPDKTAEEMIAVFELGVAVLRAQLAEADVELEKAKFGLVQDKQTRPEAVDE